MQRRDLTSVQDKYKQKDEQNRHIKAECKKKYKKKDTGVHVHVLQKYIHTAKKIKHIKI